MGAQIARPDSVPQPEFERIMAALLRGAGVAGLVGVGLVSTGAYRGDDGLQVGPGFWIQATAEPAHPVGALPVQDETASPRPVVVGEVAVRVEVVSQTAADHGDEVGVLGRGAFHQGAFGAFAITDADLGGQLVERFGDSAEVVLADIAGLDGVGHLG